MKPTSTSDGIAAATCLEATLNEIPESEISNPSAQTLTYVNTSGGYYW